MADLFDYLLWRGDLPMELVPPNPVDTLILSELCYLDFTGLVPQDFVHPVPLHVVAEAFGALPDREERDRVKQDSRLLAACAKSQRFGQLRLIFYRSELLPEMQSQFAAYVWLLPCGTALVTYRGTDTSLAGWKEDFELACMEEIPAQKEAVEYVRAVAKQYPRRKLRLGGHSKGGNLAVYAAVFCTARIQNRIDAVWSNDGPGFQTDLTQLPAYENIRERVYSIVPKSSVVGMLLEHAEDYTVVDSDQKGLMQHDGFSWQVMGDHFVKLREMTCKTCLTNLGLRDWICDLSMEQRSAFVEALFQVLTASGAKTLTDLKEESLKSVAAMVKATKELDKETREGLLKFMGLLFKGNLRLTLEGIQEDAEKKTAKLKLWEKKRSGVK